jgi:hypothetical protein
MPVISDMFSRLYEFEIELNKIRILDRESHINVA